MAIMPKVVVSTALISVLGLAACDTTQLEADVEAAMAPIEQRANELVGRLGGLRKPAVVPTNVKENLPEGIPESTVVQDARGCYGFTIEMGATSAIMVTDEQGRRICGPAA